MFEGGNEIIDVLGLRFVGARQAGGRPSSAASIQLLDVRVARRGFRSLAGQRPDFPVRRLWFETITPGASCAPGPGTGSNPLRPGGPGLRRVSAQLCPADGWRRLRGNRAPPSVDGELARQAEQDAGRRNNERLRCQRQTRGDPGRDCQRAGQRCGRHRVHDRMQCDRRRNG